MRRILLAAATAAAMALAACSGPSIFSGDLSPRQKAFDALNKFESAQIIAERVVLSQDTPAVVKDRIKLLEPPARHAVYAYVEAAKKNDPALGDYAGVALRYLTELTNYLVARGYMKVSDTGLVQPMPGTRFLAAGFFYEQVRT